MRRSILAKAVSNQSRWAFAAALLGCVAVACQDGPNQTYSPPPANANWNDGRQVLNDAGVPIVPDGTATNSTAPFTLPDGGAITAGGNNANELCTQQQIAAVTPMIDSAPILPPNGAAGLNLAGSDGDGGITWQGLTIEQAEAINCQGVSQADVLGYGTSDLDVLWDNGAVYAAYSLATSKIQQITLVAPYGGKLVATSLDGTTTYTISVDGVTPITVATTGVPGTSTLSLDWLGAANGVPASVKTFDDIYRALMATYMPTFPPEPSNLTCNQTGDCIIGAFPSNQEGYIGISPMDMFLSAGPYSIPTYANAIQEIDLQFAQVMTYSPVNPVLKMDAAGPTSIPVQLGTGAAPCQLAMGLTYQDFLANCINVSASASTNATELLELYSQFSHDEETFQFDISGVDPSFSDARLGPTQVVVDPPPQGCGADPTASQCPQDQDQQFELWIDQFTLGLFANDWQYDSNGNPTLHDLHGAGALYHQYRTLSLVNLEAEVCSGVQLPPPPTPTPDAGTTDGGTDGGLDAGDPPGDPPAVSPLSAECGAWAANPATTPAGVAAQIQNCVAPRDPVTGIPTGDPTAFQPTGCTGVENLLSADITTTTDPVNIGPIASQINPDYSLGMKMGHQQGSFCADAMSRAQIAALSYTITCPGGASSCAPLAAPAFTQLCPGGVGSCLPPGSAPFSCPQGSCDPTQGTCAAGTRTCTLSPGTNPVPLTVAQVDLIGSVGVGSYLLNTGNGSPAPAGTEVVLALPYVCTSNNLLSQTYEQVLGAVVNGVETSLPIDVQGGVSGSPSPRFFFKQYGAALIQTLEATNSTGAISVPVAQWGLPALGSAVPLRPSDLYFDSVGDGQFEIMEYVDRRFVCPDGANNCAPVGASGFTCPTKSCAVGDATCTQFPTCNANETVQPPLDIQFIADVKDGIMNSYDFNRYMYRGETALYQMIQPEGYATAQASNALFSNMFGSPLLSALGGIPPGLVDLTGQPIVPSDYAAASGTATALALSFQQQANSPIGIAQVFQGSQQAQFSFPNPSSATGSSETLTSWAPYQPGVGFDEAFYGNSVLDFFVQTSELILSGVTTDIVLDYNFKPDPTTLTGNSIEVMAAESQDYLGDVFMCWEPAANPPLLAVPMYTPTQAVINWLNSVPSSYADCGIVVRWSPYDNYINLIESTAYGVRLQVTQGGGLGRIVGATLYVPGLPYQE